jgi:DNA-binding NarL/FixJ family response regulator
MNNENNIRVVIIEDDETLLQGYEFLINNEEGFTVTGTFNSVEVAEKKLLECDPHIILLDVQLPGIKGTDAIPQLKKILPETYIIILTVYESEQLIFTALKNGASGYLTKNTPSQKIIEAMYEVVMGGGAMSATIAKMVIQSFHKNSNSPLTKRETQILEGINEGKSRGKIASELFIDLETVKTHIKNIYYKLNVNSKEEAIKIAKESKYI